MILTTFVITLSFLGKCHIHLLNSYHLYINMRFETARAPLQFIWINSSNRRVVVNKERPSPSGKGEVH